MKKTILIMAASAVLQLFPAQSGEPSSPCGELLEVMRVNEEASERQYASILKKKEVERKRFNLIAAIMHVESRGDERAYNPKEDACGAIQIRPIMLREVNRLLGYNKYKLSDRWSKKKSIELFTDFQNIANPDWEPEKAARYWNGGYGGMNKKGTIGYWNRVSAKLNQLNKQS
jgi:hypothetical protein